MLRGGLEVKGMFLGHMAVLGNLLFSLSMRLEPLPCKRIASERSKYFS